MDLYKLYGGLWYMKSMKIVLRLVFVSAVALFLPVIINYLLLLPASYIDVNSLAGGIFLSIVFYTIQTGIAIILVRSIIHTSITEMGFNLYNVKLTFRMLRWFILIWLLLVILFYGIGLNCIAGFDAFVSHYYVTNKLAMQKDFIIGCLLAGVGEEPLFRGFIITLLVPVISEYVRVKKVKIPFVAIVSGVLFALAHIEYQIMPFRILYIDVIQLSITFILGIFWSIMFLKTRSLLGPIIAHMCANTIQIMSGYIVAYFFI
jgi:membrane protease YdiL (CAAX protease family)